MTQKIQPLLGLMEYLRLKFQARLIIRQISANISRQSFYFCKALCKVPKSLVVAVDRFQLTHCPAGHIQYSFTVCPTQHLPHKCHAFHQFPGICHFPVVRFQPFVFSNLRPGIIDLFYFKGKQGNFFFSVSAVRIRIFPFFFKFSVTFIFS